MDIWTSSGAEQMVCCDCSVSAPFDVISWKVTGKLQTAATWIRDFIRNHPGYKFDSVVSEQINYDLMVAVDEM
jgi:glutamate--cysteine ligase catalytic subunit